MAVQIRTGGSDKTNTKTNMANAALVTLLQGVASGSVSPEKAAELITNQKGKELSADDLDKIAGGGEYIDWD